MCKDFDKEKWIKDANIIIEYLKEYGIEYNDLINFVVGCRIINEDANSYYMYILTFNNGFEVCINGIKLGIYNLVNVNKIGRIVYGSKWKVKKYINGKYLKNNNKTLIKCIEDNSRDINWQEGRLCTTDTAQFNKAKLNKSIELFSKIDNKIEQFLKKNNIDNLKDYKNRFSVKFVDNGVAEIKSVKFNITIKVKIDKDYNIVEFAKID